MIASIRCLSVLALCNLSTLLFGVAASAAQPAGGPAPVRVIFDTDVGSDVDDAGAFAVLHALADRGEVQILAVGISNGHPLAAPYTDAVNTWYGRPNLPVGVIRSKPPFEHDHYLKPIVARYPHDLSDKEAPNVVSLYRRVLAAQPDKSVTFVVIGPPTNIEDLLKSGPDKYSSLSGVELMRRKVIYYGSGGNGAGKLPKGHPGYNYMKDVSAARYELRNMPTNIPFVLAGGSGYSLALGTFYRKAPANHIIRRSYEAFYDVFPNGGSMDRPTWDQLRTLHAGRPSSRAHFRHSPLGEITLTAKNILTWEPSPNRNQRYAYLRKRGLVEVRKQLTELMLYIPSDHDDEALVRELNAE